MTLVVRVRCSLYVYSCIYLTYWSCIVTCLVGLVTFTLLSDNKVLGDFPGVQSGLDKSYESPRKEFVIYHVVSHNL